MLEWYVGFHAPSFRDKDGKIAPTLWFGHVEIWGYTVDETWLFFDPQGRSVNIVVTHHHDDVLDHLAARFSTCKTILKLPAESGRKLFPIHMPMTCATVVGHILGIRAFVPSGLRKKLLAKGAEVIHGNPEGRSEG